MARTYQLLTVVGELRTKLILFVARNELHFPPENLQHIVVRRVFRFLDRDAHIAFQKRKSCENIGSATGKHGNVIGRDFC